MRKTLTVSALALAFAALGAAAAQAQDRSASPDAATAVEEAHWRGGQDDGRRGGRHDGQSGRHHADRHGGGHRGGDMMRQMEVFDLDSDGAITQAEIDQFRQGQITEFDANSNGTLSLEEYQALWLDRMRERMVDAFQEHDDDGDGQVTAEEFNERFAGLVERLDRNGDGELSRDDRRGNRRPASPEDPAQPDAEAVPDAAPEATPTPQ